MIQQLLIITYLLIAYIFYYKYMKTRKGTILGHLVTYILCIVLLIPMIIGSIAKVMDERY